MARAIDPARPPSGTAFAGDYATSRRMVTEASGGVTPATARAIAETGVDVISLGWLTHSAPALDVALDLE